MKDSMEGRETWGDFVLAALYLRGLPRRYDPPPRSWMRVDALARASSGLPDVIDRLRDAGLWIEANVLEGAEARESPLGASARAAVAEGRVLTPLSPLYPLRWISVLGEGAPPALWRRPRPVADLPSQYVTIVGSRGISRQVRDFAREAGYAVAAAGHAVFSGGAIGCDRAAAEGARQWAREHGVHPPLVELEPCGLDRAQSSRSGEQWSLAPPDASFSAALAMERNALLYAASARSLVVQCRFREGGTWTGATSALRRRLTALVVRADGREEGLGALVALGGVPLPHPALITTVPLPERSVPLRLALW